MLSSFSSRLSGCRFRSSARLRHFLRSLSPSRRRPHASAPPLHPHNISSPPLHPTLSPPFFASSRPCFFCRLFSLLPQGLVSFVASFLCFLKALFLLSPPFFASSRPCSFVFPRQSLPRINEALCFTASLSTHEHLTCCPPTPSALRCRFPLNTQVSGVGSRV